MVAHIEAADVVHEMTYESEVLRRKRCNAKVLYAKNHRQKIANKLNLYDDNEEEYEKKKKKKKNTTKNTISVPI